MKLNEWSSYPSGFPSLAPGWIRNKATQHDHGPQKVKEVAIGDILYVFTTRLCWILDGPQQSPGQAPVCAELSCQESQPHQAPATHHPHPPPIAPVKSHVSCKILLTSKSFHALAPQYLSIVRPHTLSRNLRSSDAGLLTTPHTNLQTFEDRAFAVAAPTL